MKIGVGVACWVAVIAAAIIAGIFFLRKRKLASIEDINEETINIIENIGYKYSYEWWWSIWRWIFIIILFFIKNHIASILPVTVIKNHRIWR